MNRGAREFAAKYKAKHGVAYRSRFPKAYARYEYTESLRQRDAARRARLVGATVESFTHGEVFERDEWTCGICADAVDSGLVWPDPLSPSLDHVVPLSHGGDHSRANTRLAHLICNIRRGAARDEEAA